MTNLNIISRRTFLVPILASLFVTPISQAAITTTGQITDVSGNPVPIENAIAIGYDGLGTLKIDNASSVDSASVYSGVYIGFRPESTGSATIDGPNSSWQLSRLVVGLRGEGSLNINNHATVNVQNETHVRLRSAGSGNINFDNGTLNTNSLFVNPENLNGTGTINTHGIVTDTILEFDQTHSSNRTIVFNQKSNQNINVNLSPDPTSNYYGLQAVGAGYVGSGTLNISDGVSLVSNSGYLGYHAPASGIANISGENTTWEVTNLRVAYDGNAVLNIENGAKVKSNSPLLSLSQGSNSITTISGENSRLEAANLTVGFSGNASLNIENQGSAEIKNTITLGKSTTGYGEINFNNGTLNAGSLFASTENLHGTGTINTHGLLSDIDLVFDQSQSTNKTIILNALENQDITLNFNTNDEGVFDTLGAGYKSSGSLAITQGRIIKTKNTILAYHEGAVATAKISGQGSILESRNLKIALKGSATLTIDQGGTAIATNTIIGGYDPGGRGVGAYGYGSAIVVVKGENAILQTDSLTMGSLGSASLNIQDKASVSVLDSLNIYENSEINLSLSTTNAPFIDILGDVTLNGNLNILTDELTTLTLGDTFILLEIGGEQSGTFTNLAENDIAAYYNNIALRLTYLGGDGNDIALITTQPPDIGDANGDNLINQLDLDLVQQHLGTNNFQGDANHDGIVNLADLFAVRNNFTPSSSVPEPTTLLTFLALAPLTQTRRKNK